MLLSNFSYENDKVKITAKKGFIFDGASVPKLFWQAVGHPFSYKLLRPAVIHDICYETEYFYRDFSDGLFKEMLDVADIAGAKEHLAYLAVRVAGGETWKPHTEKGIMEALKFIEVVEKTT